MKTGTCFLYLALVTVSLFGIAACGGGGGGSSETIAGRWLITWETSAPALTSAPGCNVEQAPFQEIVTINITGTQRDAVRTGGTTSRSSARPRWSPAGSIVVYTPEQVRALSPIREEVEKRLVLPERRDVFLCHAWDDRSGSAKELHDLLEALGVSVWFSEKDVLLGTSLLREIDKGLAKSRVGVVLVTRAFLRRIQNAGIADKELSALLARDLLVPIVHGTTYEELREVSPLLGSRTGLDTAEDPMATVAIKLSELVAPEQCSATVT